MWGLLNAIWRVIFLQTSSLEKDKPVLKRTASCLSFVIIRNCTYKYEITLIRCDNSSALVVQLKACHLPLTDSDVSSVNSLQRCDLFLGYLSLKPVVDPMLWMWIYCSWVIRTVCSTTTCLAYGHNSKYNPKPLIKGRVCTLSVSPKISLAKRISAILLYYASCWLIGLAESRAINAYCVVISLLRLRAVELNYRASCDTQKLYLVRYLWYIGLWLSVFFREVDSCRLFLH